MRRPADRSACRRGRCEVSDWLIHHPASRWRQSTSAHNHRSSSCPGWTHPLLRENLIFAMSSGASLIYATGVACQQGTLTPPDTWSCPTLGLACVLMSRPISPELVLSPDFWILNIPRYFSFAYKEVFPNFTWHWNLLFKVAPVLCFLFHCTMYNVGLGPIAILNFVFPWTIFFSSNFYLTSFQTCICFTQIYKVHGRFVCKTYEGCP